MRSAERRVLQTTSGSSSGSVRSRSRPIRVTLPGAARSAPRRNWLCFVMEVLFRLLNVGIRLSNISDRRHSHAPERAGGGLAGDDAKIFDQLFQQSCVAATGWVTEAGNRNSPHQQARRSLKAKLLRRCPTDASISVSPQRFFAIGDCGASLVHAQFGGQFFIRAGFIRTCFASRASRSAGRCSIESTTGRNASRKRRSDR
jgi:hypothetical protein